MSKIDNGGAAFQMVVPDAGCGDAIEKSHGMPLLDYFAAAALQGILSAGSVAFANATTIGAARGMTPEAVMAESAYQFADAMIAEKRKREAST